MRKYEAEVYEALVNSGYSEEQAEAMDPKEVLEHFLSWEGIIGYDSAIGGIMEAYAQKAVAESHVYVLREYSNDWANTEQGGGAMTTIKEKAVSDMHRLATYERSRMDRWPAGVRELTIAVEDESGRVVDAERAFDRTGK